MRLFPVLLSFLVACVDQALVDEVEVKCDAWITTANACAAALGGGGQAIDPTTCDPVNDAAQTSSNADLEAAIDLLDCQIAAYDTDCSTPGGTEAATDAAEACLDAAQ